VSTKLQLFFIIVGVCFDLFLVVIVNDLPPLSRLLCFARGRAANFFRGLSRWCRTYFFDLIIVRWGCCKIVERMRLTLKLAPSGSPSSAVSFLLFLLDVPSSGVSDEGAADVMRLA